MINNPKKSLSLTNSKPLFDDDLDLEEERKIENEKTNKPISTPPILITDLSKFYMTDLKYILEKAKNGNLLAKPKDPEFIEAFIDIFEENATTFKNKKVKKLCFDGIPDICKRIRPLCWRILLNYLSDDKTQWQSIEENNKKQYEDHVNLFLLGKNKPSANSDKNSQSSQEIEFKKCQDHPLSKAKNSTWNTFFSDQSLWDEIEKDTKRTRKEINFFTLENTKNLELKYPSLSKNKKETKSESHHEALTRILFIFAKKNPKIGYAQGMNEILAPIYFCFINDDKNSIFGENAEADSFICFQKLMAEIQENFIKIPDSNKIGLEIRMKDFNELLKKIDSRVYEHLKKKGVSVHLFGFQWLLLLLSQEFIIDDVLKLWDSILSNDNKKEYVMYMCSAILYILREDILKGEYSDIILTLQNIKDMDVKLIQEKAKSLFNEYVVCGDINK